MKTEILYEDEHIVIAAKASGTLSIPDRFNAELPNIKAMLERQLGIQLWTVHRLDRDTSGLICFAKNDEAHRYMSMLFQEHQVQKLYAGIVHGRPQPQEGRIEAPIAEHLSQKGRMVIHQRGKLSVTDYKVAEQFAAHALMQFQIHTGRTHQIRVHMQYLGHPIVCDPLYGDGAPFLLSTIKSRYKLSQAAEEERPILSRLALHAYALAFEGIDGMPVRAEAPLPKDMAAAVRQMEKWSKGPQF